MSNAQTGWNLRLKGEDAKLAISPTVEHEECDCTSSNYIPTNTDGRVIYADSAGIIKFDYKNAKGETKTEVKYLVAGSMYSVMYITKVYQYYTGSTASTAKIYNSSGILVNGLKIRW